MPKPQSGENKKHGDKLEDLIERSGGKAVPERGPQRANPADVQQDDEDVLDDRDADELEEDEGADEYPESDDERDGPQH